MYKWKKNCHERARPFFLRHLLFSGYGKSCWRAKPFPYKSFIFTENLNCRINLLSFSNARVSNLAILIFRHTLPLSDALYVIAHNRKCLRLKNCHVTPAAKGLIPYPGFKYHQVFPSSRMVWRVVNPYLKAESKQSLRGNNKLRD